MKLNKKVPVLIIPVLFTSFLIITTGLYVIERNSVKVMINSSIEMEATELTGIFSQYGLAARGILGSIVQSDAMRRFLESNDNQYKSLALGSGLDGILNNLANLTSEHFSIMIMKGNNSVEYYYENSLNPFAEPPGKIKQWGEDLLSTRQHSATHYFSELERLSFCRILDRVTLKPTIDLQSENTLVIIVSLSPTDYLNRVSELESATKTISFWDISITPPISNKYEARRTVAGYGTIGVTMETTAVDFIFRKTLARICIGFILLMLITHLVLQWLLRRYVINPINRLEKQLDQIDLEKTLEISIHQANDEIGSLSKSFAGLYEKLKETYESTKELAEKDTLTSLYNRRVFNLILTKLINRGARDKSMVSLMYLDIDNFKYVNDYYGHTVGDALLRSFALRLHEVVRGHDIILNKPARNTTVARLAGDEFAVILAGFTDDKAIGKISKRILEICKNGFTCEEGTFPVTLSIGIATYPHDGNTADALIVNADSAMYESKKSGKNTVSFYSEELSELSRRQQALEIALKNIDFKEFEIFYMPIIDSRTGKIHSLEALLRWFSKTLGPVSPAEFIPLAEGLGIFRDIDLWVLDQVFGQAAMLQDRFGKEITISINISAAEFSDENFTSFIFPLLESHDIAPEIFTLEITETFYQDHSETGLKTLQSLSDAGFQLAIDDLGSGYTSLLQLVEIPVDIVKIDRSFIEKTLSTGKKKTLHSLIDFCHSQNLLVTAEGIETEEILCQLKDINCDYLQGFYFSKPLPPEELMKLNGSWAI